MTKNKYEFVMSKSLNARDPRAGTRFGTHRQDVWFLVVEFSSNQTDLQLLIQ